MQERRAELIKELASEDEDAEFAAELEAEKEAEGMRQHMEEHQSAAMGGAIGEVMSATLDYLAKELVRRREVERISQTVVEAQEVRRKREAEEAGRRQVRQRSQQVLKGMVYLSCRLKTWFARDRIWCISSLCVFMHKRQRHG